MKNVFYRKSSTEKACTRAAICNPKRIYSEFLTDYTSGMTEDDKDDFISVFPSFNSIRMSMCEFDYCLLVLYNVQNKSYEFDYCLLVLETEKE